MSVPESIATAAEREQQAVRELLHEPCSGCGHQRRRLLVKNGRAICMECGFKCPLPNPKSARRPPVLRAAIIDHPIVLPRPRARHVSPRGRDGNGERDDGGGDDGGGSDPPPPRSGALFAGRRP